MREQAITEGLASHSENSFGFRPGRRCHDALRELSQTVEWEGTNYIAEVDIKGFFDNVTHDWMKMLGHRIADQRVLRLVKRFLKSGVMEQGQIRANERSRPPARTYARKVESPNVRHSPAPSMSYNSYGNIRGVPRNGEATWSKSPIVFLMILRNDKE